jgi:hypothetical protein
MLQRELPHGIASMLAAAIVALGGRYVFRRERPSR